MNNRYKKTLIALLLTSSYISPANFKEYTTPFLSQACAHGTIYTINVLCCHALHHLLPSKFIEAHQFINKNTLSGEPSSVATTLKRDMQNTLFVILNKQLDRRLRKNYPHNRPIYYISMSSMFIGSIIIRNLVEHWGTPHVVFALPVKDAVSRVAYATALGYGLAVLANQIATSIFKQFQPIQKDHPKVDLCAFSANALVFHCLFNHRYYVSDTLRSIVSYAIIRLSDATI